MEKFNPDISVIVCTYERYDDLADCLNSLTKQKFQNFEIIIVVPEHDKKSILISEKYSKVKIVLQKHGKGLSYARNLGISASLGNVLAFIDDDAEADAMWLYNLHRCYNDKKISAVGGLVLDKYHNNIQFKNGLVSVLGDIKVNEQFSDENGNVSNNFWLNQMMGTNSSFRGDVIRKLGGFDPAYRYYFDETELCVRLIKQGFKIAHANDAIVFHKFSDGINRSGYWDNNWSEILKNTMRLSLTYFYKNSSIKRKFQILFHPILYRFREFYHAKKNKSISFSMLLKIYYRLCKGFINSVNLSIFQKYEKKQWIPEKKDIEIIIPSSANKLRICLISKEFPPGKIGGIGRYTHILAKKLAKKGNVVHVITSNGDDRIEDGVIIHVIEPITQNSQFKLNLPVVENNIRYSLAVTKQINEINQTYGLDIIEAPLWDVEGFAYSCSKNMPIVIRVETPIFKVAEINNWDINDDLLVSMELEKKYLESADGLIAISTDIKNTLLSKYKIQNKNWFLNPIGVEISKSTEPIKNNFPIVLFVGRLEKRKGVENIVNSIPQVANKFPDVKFLFVGSDTKISGNSYKQFLENQIDKKYSKNYEFLEYVDENKLKQLYSDCTVFIAPSIYESFGIIFLEAMNAAKPVIGTLTGGIPEVVESGKTGFLVEPGNEKELLGKIIYLLDNPEECKKMGENGRKRIEKLFSDEKFANDSIEIYSKVITKAKTSNSKNYKQSDQESILHINS